MALLLRLFVALATVYGPAAALRPPKEVTRAADGLARTTAVPVGESPRDCEDPSRVPANQFDVLFEFLQDLVDDPPHYREAPSRVGNKRSAQGEAHGGEGNKRPCLRDAEIFAVETGKQTSTVEKPMDDSEVEDRISLAEDPMQRRPGKTLVVGTPGEKIVGAYKAFLKMYTSEKYSRFMGNQRGFFDWLLECTSFQLEDAQIEVQTLTGIQYYVCKANYLWKPGKQSYYVDKDDLDQLLDHIFDIVAACDQGVSEVFKALGIPKCSKSLSKLVKTFSLQKFKDYLSDRETPVDYSQYFEQNCNFKPSEQNSAGGKAFDCLDKCLQYYTYQGDRVINGALRRGETHICVGHIETWMRSQKPSRGDLYRWEARWDGSCGENKKMKCLDKGFRSTTRKPFSRSMQSFSHDHLYIFRDGFHNGVSIPKNHRQEFVQDEAEVLIPLGTCVEIVLEYDVQNNPNNMYSLYIQDDQKMQWGSWFETEVLQKFLKKLQPEGVQKVFVVQPIQVDGVCT